MRATVIVFFIVLMMCSCASKAPLPPSFSMQRSQWRPITKMPTAVYSDTIPVVKFREVCDVLARNMITQPFITSATRPPVITIRKLQNKTGLTIDETIFQETVRVKLMEYSGGRVLFRDDLSYNDIVRERVRQSGEDITVSLTDSIVETKTHDRIKEREYDTGTLSGLGGTQEYATNVEKESAMDMDQTAVVKAGIANADYFLRGILYQVKEENASRPGTGMNYFQYQFRLTDARSGLIVWEKMLDSKLAGEYEPVRASQVQSSQQQPGTFPGGPSAVPPGWPQGQPGQSWPTQGQTQSPQGVQQQQQSIQSWP